MQKSLIRKDAKRRVISNAAVKVLSEKGYNETTIKDIADEAGISVGSFYSYFKDKEDLVAKLYDEILKITIQISANVSMESGNVETKFTRALTCSIWTFARNKELSKILLFKCIGINQVFEKKRWDIMDSIIDFLKQVLIHLSENHSIIINDFGMTSVALAQSIMGVLAYWLNGKLERDINDLAYNLSVYHLNALNIKYSDKDVKQCIESLFDRNYDEILNGGR